MQNERDLELAETQKESCLGRNGVMSWVCTAKQAELSSALLI